MVKYNISICCDLIRCKTVIVHIFIDEYIHKNYNSVVLNHSVLWEFHIQFSYGRIEVILDGTDRFIWFGKISKILLKLAPPVMLAQLIQALYNIIDSLFVGKYSDSGLTALSIIYPVQLLMIAFAVGTGVGINTAMAAKLGLYYKWQTFFFIPLGAMQTCIVPIISYNYAAGKVERCKKTLGAAVGFGLVLMGFGTLCFVTILGQMLRVFTADTRVIEIGRIGFRFVGVSFLPMVTSLIFPVFFQAVGSSLKSSLLTVIRTVVLFVPLGFVFSRFGLNWFWLTFPVTELLTSIVGAVFYRQFLGNGFKHSRFG